jgi:serine protease Do
MAMARSFLRARILGASAIAFAAGLVFAAGFDLTPLSHAQQRDTRPLNAEVKPLAEVSNAFNKIAADVTPAVVSIDAERDPREARQPRGQQRIPPGLEDFFRQFEQPGRQLPEEASGSGFIVSKDGYILTNNHVVADFDRVRVTLTDRRTFSAKVVGRDPDTDLAVIKIDAENLPTAKLGDDTQAQIGDWVLAIGNPLGLDFTVTAGIVSARGRAVRGLQPQNQYAISDFIQTDAAINPGNSGGPLVNIRGEVIGVNSAIASQTGFYSGYGFAIPVTLAKNVMEDLIAHGRVRRAVIGVSISEIDAEDARAAGLQQIAGVKVSGFSEGPSPARDAGLQPGDIIVAVDGQRVDYVNELQRIVRSHEPGETITVEAMRFGERKTFRLKLTEAPREEQVAAAPERAAPRSEENVNYERLGISVEPVSDELARRANLTAEQRGLVVTDVASTGPAHNRLFEGYIILQVINPPPRRPIRSSEDLRRVLGSVDRGDYLSFTVYDPRFRQSTVVNVQVR